MYAKRSRSPHPRLPVQQFVHEQDVVRVAQVDFLRAIKVEPHLTRSQGRLSWLCYDCRHWTDEGRHAEEESWGCKLGLFV